MAECIGFEPMLRLSPEDGLANRCLRPLGQHSINLFTKYFTMQKIYSQYLNLPQLDLSHDIGDASNFQHRYLAQPEAKIRQLDGTYLGCTTYIRHTASQYYIDKFFELIPELKGLTGDIGWQIHENSLNLDSGVQMTVHTDGPRGPFVISYMIEKGGDNIITRWYQEHGQPIERAPKIGFTKDQIPYENLTELESIEIELNRWILFRSDILHDVKPIMTRRKCFTVGFFDKDLYFYLVEKYGIL